MPCSSVDLCCRGTLEHAKGGLCEGGTVFFGWLPAAKTTVELPTPQERKQGTNQKARRAYRLQLRSAPSGQEVLANRGLHATELRGPAAWSREMARCTAALNS